MGGAETDRVNSLDDCQASVNNPLILEKIQNQCFQCWSCCTHTLLSSSLVHTGITLKPRSPLIPSSDELLPAWTLGSDNSDLYTHQY